MNDSTLKDSWRIFTTINSNKFTEDEKAHAIYDILSMATHMSITKDAMLTVIRYLFDKLYTVEETADNNASL